MAKIFDLKRITTKGENGLANGWMVPAYKKDDPNFADYDMKFVYVSAISPGRTKGPHLHKKRECRLTCIQGYAEVIIREDGEYKKYTLSFYDPKILVIKAGQPFMISAPPWAEKDTILLNFANHIWKEDDQDNYKPDDWDSRCIRQT